MAYKNPIQSVIDQVRGQISAEDFFGVPWSQELDNHLNFRAGPISDWKVYGKWGAATDTFAAVAASLFAARLGVPVAPVVAYAIPDDTEFFLYASLGCFNARLPIDRVLDHENPREMEREDVLNWRKAAAEIALPPGKIHSRLFNATLPHVSALVPFLNWIGEGDNGAHNTVLDSTALRKNLSRPLGLGKVGIYGIDAYIQHQDFTGPAESFVAYYQSFPGFYDLRARIWDMNDVPYAQRERGDNIVIDIIRERLPPAVDWKITGEIARRITTLGDRTITAECERIGTALSDFSSSAKVKTKLKTEATRTAQLLTDRRDSMELYLSAAEACAGKPRKAASAVFTGLEEEFHAALAAKDGLIELKQAFGLPAPRFTATARFLPFRNIR